VTLSVTMILYNGMMYIIQSWQWKDSKSLMKNIVLIVVGILISFFSVVIIRLIQSIPWTLDEELKSENGNKTDNEILMQKITSIPWAPGEGTISEKDNEINDGIVPQKLN
jgi:hypothetical protein